MTRGPFVRRLYAHRGASALAPENTLPAFRRALEDGATALEMDLRLTQDGRPVIAHDRTGWRTCGVRAEIARSTLEEVRRWDAGAGFRARDGSRPFAGTGVRIPTLEEVLAASGEAPLNIDLKAPGPDVVAPTIAAIRRAGAEERTLLTSFRRSTLARLRALLHP